MENSQKGSEIRSPFSRASHRARKQNRHDHKSQWHKYGTGRNVVYLNMGQLIDFNGADNRSKTCTQQTEKQENNNLLK